MRHLCKLLRVRTGGRKRIRTTKRTVLSTLKIDCHSHLGPHIVSDRMVHGLSPRRIRLVGHGHQNGVVITKRALCIFRMRPTTCTSLTTGRTRGTTLVGVLRVDSINDFNHLCLNNRRQSVLTTRRTILKTVRSVSNQRTPGDRHRR